MSFQGDLQAVLAPLATGGCYPVANDSESIVFPYITFTGISWQGVVIHNSSEGKRRIQIDVFGTSYNEVHTLQATIDTTLNASSLNCSKINEIDAFEEETKNYRGILEYYFWA